MLFSLKNNFIILFCLGIITYAKSEDIENEKFLEKVITKILPGNQYTIIMNKANGLCLSVSADGERIKSETCEENENKFWFDFEKTEYGFIIRDYRTRLVFQTYAGWFGSDLKVYSVQFQLGAEGNTFWTVENGNDSNSILIKNVYAKACIGNKKNSDIVELNTECDKNDLDNLWILGGRKLIY